MADLLGSGGRVALRVVALTVLGACAWGVGTASAVPAFARKYGTSCQTCHTIFPKLNAYGVAFRLRGYRMPNQTEDMVKEKPVSLGAPAYKRLWPNAVWPGEIAGAVPLAINAKFAYANSSTLNPDGTVTTSNNDFQFPQEVNIFGAGTLGDHISYLTEITFTENPDSSVSTELEHANIAFDSPFGPEDLLHIRIGKMMPNVVDGFQEMQIMTDAGIDSLFAYNPIGLHGGFGLVGDTSPSPISLPASVRGIEGYGIIKHRAMWVAGLANGIEPGLNGRFDGNSAKDVYARFDYKFGGMGLDGDTSGMKEIPNENWRDDSLRVGAFVYRGDGSNIDFPSALADETPITIQDVHFLRTGLYASLYVRDLNVFATYVHGSDTLTRFGPAANPVGTIAPTYDAWFAEADYIFYPWLHGAVRYETVSNGDPSVPSLRTAVFNASALIRANVKAMFEYQRDLRAGENHSLNAIVRVAF
jgi:hypothetical protein